MKLYSTLDRKVVDIVPLVEDRISIYSCGPTVYYDMHIGNIRAYVNWDVLQRALIYLGYDVNRIMNITDVGHMSTDADFGEDKIQKQATFEHKDPLDIANYYIKSVLKDFSDMNILSPKGNVVDPKMSLTDLKKEGWTRATDYIDEMITLISMIVENGYTYETSQALYFDVSKISDYNIFTNQSLDEKQEGVRDEVGIDPQKKNPADFVLWMKLTGKYANHLMHWSSPWGEGFPGWHIECSAMSTSVLGEHFDIHTGGIDHLSVHHPNERAQNIGAFGQPVVKYWIHNDFLTGVEGEKLSKSKGNGVTLGQAVALGFDPMDVRYLFMSVSYRAQLKYTREALEGARNARLSIISKLKNLYSQNKHNGVVLEDYKKEFSNELENNLNMSGALAIVSKLLKSSNKPEDILSTIYDFDNVFGLRLKDSVESEEDIPSEVLDLAKKRNDARLSKDFGLSDRYRDQISKLGYKVIDTPNGFNIEKI